MEPKTARDVMVPLEDYPHLYDNQTLREAVRQLDNTQIQVGGRTSMPRILMVLDENSHLVGMVRRRDILRGLEPSFHTDIEATQTELSIPSDIDPNLAELMSEDDSARLSHRLDRPLSEVVREVPGQVNADDSLMKVVREIVGNDTHVAAVIENDTVVGVARSLDVLRAVCEGLY